MNVVKLVNGQFDSIVDIRKEFPNISFPSVLTNESLPDGYKVISYEEIVVQEGMEISYDSLPTEVNEEWVVKVKYTPVSVYVPTSVAPLQTKLQLLEMGLLDDVELIVKENRKYGIYWENAQSIERNSVILLEILTLLDLTEAQVDEMFIAASKIVV